MSIEQIQDKIKGFWINTPAVVVVKEIKRRTEMPKWEDCPKDHIFVGISRRKRGDKITVVRHQIEMAVDCTVTTECLGDKEWYFTGAVPHEQTVCSNCGEFSTRINIDGRCQDCNPKKAVKGA